MTVIVTNCGYLVQVYRSQGHCHVTSYMPNMYYTQSCKADQTQDHPGIRMKYVRTVPVLSTTAY